MNESMADRMMSEMMNAGERVKPPFADCGAPALGGRRKFKANASRDDDVAE